MSTTEQNPVIDEVADPFVRKPGEPKRRHHGAWRFYGAADRRIALCGAPLTGNIVPPGEVRPDCERCHEIARELIRQGYGFRKGPYPGVPT